MILLVSDRQTVRGLPVSHFLPSGIFTYTCPFETARFFAREKQISGAILDGIPSLAQAQALAEDLRAEYPELPMLLIAAPEDLPNAPAQTVRDAGDLPALAEHLLAFIRRTVGWQHDFSTFSLSLSLESNKATLLGYPFALSFRELAILRCLFAFAPNTVSADDLLLLCFPEGRQRAANLSVQISRINRRAAKLGLSNLILSEYGNGYRLNRAVLT